jgi:hypothetical protein
LEILPEVSSTIGPLGTAGAGGAGPRPDGTSLTSSRALSFIQSNGAPRTSLSATPSMRAARAVAASPTHSSTPSSRSTVKANFRPSFDQTGALRLVPAGSSTGRAFFSSNRLTAIAVARTTRCRAPRAASMRNPPSRRNGRASAEIGGLAS